MYGLVVFVMIGQALKIMQLQYNNQVMSIYSASVLFYLAGFILWNLGRRNRKFDNNVKKYLFVFR